MSVGTEGGRSMQLCLCLGVCGGAPTLAVHAEVVVAI